MSESQNETIAAAAPATARSIMPPYLVLQDFLDESTVLDLLDHARAREPEFAPTRTNYRGKGGVKPQVRVSVGTRDLGPFQAILKAKVMSLVPELVTKLQVTAVELPELETELVAHNDGAFFKRHIDTQTASDCDPLRVLSAVFYFYNEPKAFFGGTLRLYAIGSASAANYVDIEPVRNSLLVFPSWAPHEVMPVSCPSKQFADSRFAINCWVCRKRRTEP